MEFTILHEFPAARLEAAWHDCLDRVECPAHYDAPEFFLEPFWAGRGPFAVLALDGDAVTGVLTGLHEGEQVNAGLPSRPQICVDATRDQPAVLDALARGLLQESGRAKLVSVYTWPSLTLETFERFRFRLRKLEGDVVLDLTQGPSALFKQFTHERRKNIRRAIKEGVEVSQATSDEEVSEAYEVYDKWRLTTRKQIKLDATPYPVFQRMHRLRNNRRLFVARYAGKIVACTAFRFFPRGLLEASENFSLDEFLHVRPNDLVYWRAIEWACQEGFRRHSLGGAHLFHRKAGGTIVPIYRYRLDRTWLRRHDRMETLRDLGRAAVRKAPPPVEKAVRRLLGREKRIGW
ncbi:MAG TPA: GNAT family N-acetyltransferase [Terriglobia bacterium]|nr:GNAT family N-acetyltransferase [Terriglobia bacterium]